MRDGKYLIRKTILIMIALILQSSLNCCAYDWREIKPGIKYLNHKTSHPWDIHVIKIDLLNKNIKIRHVLPNDKYERGEGETTSSMARRVGAVVAVNADYFGRNPSKDNYHKAEGTTFVEGKKHNTNPYRSAIAFSKNNDKSEINMWSSSEPWFYNVFGGGPIFVIDGRYAHNPLGEDLGDKHRYNPEPHTAVGLSKDKKTLFLVVVDGRQKTSRGMNSKELGDFMIGLGVDRAMFFDGGGSSTLYMEGEVINNPSDGTERYVANALATIYEPEAPTESNQDPLSPSEAWDLLPHPEPYSKIEFIVEGPVHHLGDNRFNTPVNVGFVRRAEGIQWSRKFHFPADHVNRTDGYIVMNIRGAENSSVYLNGKLIGRLRNTLQNNGRAQAYKILPGIMKPGENTIMVISHLTQGTIGGIFPTDSYDNDDIEFHDVTVFYGDIRPYYEP